MEEILNKCKKGERGKGEKKEMENRETFVGIIC